MALVQRSFGPTRFGPTPRTAMGRSADDLRIRSICKSVNQLEDVVCPRGRLPSEPDTASANCALPRTPPSPFSMVAL